MQRKKNGIVRNQEKGNQENDRSTAIVAQDRKWRVQSEIIW